MNGPMDQMDDGPGGRRRYTRGIFTNGQRFVVPWDDSSDELRRCRKTVVGRENVLAAAAAPAVTSALVVPPSSSDVSSSPAPPLPPPPPLLEE